MENARKLLDGQLADMPEGARAAAAADIAGEPLFDTVARGAAPYGRSPANLGPTNRERGGA